MKEKLFSRATQSTERKWHLMSVFFKLILLPLLCIPCLYGAHELIQSDPPQESQGMIFVTGNATIHGVSEISNAKIINFPAKVVSPNAVGSKKHDGALKKQVVPNKNQDKKALKKLQQEIDKKVNKLSYSGSSDSDLMRLAQIKGTAQATGTGFFFKFGKTAVAVEPFSCIFSLQSARQIIFTAFSNIQIDTPITSFLRGPPLKIEG